MVKADISCGICLDNTSPYQVKDSDNSAWATLTACGHLFHESCILYYQSTKPRNLCPLSCASRVIYAHEPPASGVRRKVAHPVQRVYNIDVVRSDSRSPAQPSSSAAVVVPEVRDRLRSRASQGGGRPAEVIEVSEEESEAEEEPQPPAQAGPSGGARPAVGLPEIMRLRREMAELRNSLGVVRAERDELRPLTRELEQAQARLDELEGDVELLREENENFLQELHTIEEERDGLREGQPVRELEAAKVEIALLEERTKLLAGQIELHKAKENEDDNEWRRKQIEWREKEARLNERINTSGNAGAQQIKKLRAELDEKDKLIFDTRVECDRLELNVNTQLAKLKADHAAETKRLTERTTEAEQARQRAEKRAEDKLDEIARLKQANAHYEKREAKRQQQTRAQKAPVIPSSPETGPSPHRPLAGPLSPRKGAKSPKRPPLRPTNTFLDGEDSSPAPQIKITMNGRAAGKKRSVAQIGVSDDEEFMAATQEAKEESDDDDIIIDGPSEPPSKRNFTRTLSGPSSFGSRSFSRTSSQSKAFPTLAPTPESSSHWAQQPQPSQSSSSLAKDKYMPDLSSQSVRPAGDKIRHKVAKPKKR